MKYIYESEIRDGLEDRLKNNKISLASNISSINFDATKLPKLNTAIAKANPNQPDLFYRYAILASVGWNKNDDIFDIEQTWAARITPTDKQLNYNHDDSCIIGHMTEHFIMSEDGTLIDTSSDVIPEKFDIGVAFVLYTALENEERNKQVSEIISSIDDNDWFVSMECKFPDFDYGVIDKDGNQQTIARNKETSFLTKYLRAYGGNGVYKDYKIGRLLKGFFFSGMGVVKNPANPRSIIFSSKDSTTFKSQGSINIMEGKNMDEDMKKLQSELEKAKSEILSLKKENDEFKNAKASEVNSKIETLTTEITGLKSAKAEVELKLSTKEKEFEDVLAKANETKSELAKATKALEDAKAERVKSERINKLKTVGLTEEESTKAFEKFANLSDEQFEDIVKLHTKASTKEDTKEEVKQKADFTKAEVDSTITNTQVEVNESAKASERIEKLSAFFSASASKKNKTKEQ